MDFDLNSKGYIKQRETQSIELKETFRLGESILEYARTLIGMANNQGGELVFGIQDSPHIPVGLSDDRFDKFDSKDLNKIFLEYFSYDVEWSSEIVERHGLRFGIIRVKQANVKPVVCIKNHNGKKLREGAIYYRYRGETKEIRHTELLSLLQAEKEKEKLLWMQHIQSIAKIGPQSVHIFDSLKGEMNFGKAKVLVDSSLVHKLNLIKEGEFNETTGAPTLKIVGELEGLISHDHAVYTETAYPHIQSTIKTKLGITQYDFQALLLHFSVKGNALYHTEINTGSKSKVSKYSEKLLNFLRNELRTNPSTLAQARDDYKKTLKPKKSRKRKI